MTSKRISARFYATPAGNQPVKDWLAGLDAADRHTVGKDLAKVEYGWPIGMPVCRPLGGGLYEVRSTIRQGQVEARVYFAVDGAWAVLLHGHEGKSRQDHEINVARSRWADYQRRKGRGP